MKPCTSVRYTGHSLQRMFERGLSNEEVIYTLQAGEAIAKYPVDDQAVHVVVSQNPGNDECYIITAYYPSSEIWADDFKARRSQ